MPSFTRPLEAENATPEAIGRRGRWFLGVAVALLVLAGIGAVVLLVVNG